MNPVFYVVPQRLEPSFHPTPSQLPPPMTQHYMQQYPTTLYPPVSHFPQQQMFPQSFAASYTSTSASVRDSTLIQQPLTSDKSYIQTLPLKQQKQLMAQLIYQQQQTQQQQQQQQLQQQRLFLQQQQQQLQQNSHHHHHQQHLSSMMQPLLLSQQQQHLQSLAQMPCNFQPPRPYEAVTSMGHSVGSSNASGFQSQTPLWLSQPASHFSLPPPPPPPQPQFYHTYPLSHQTQYQPRVDVFAPKAMIQRQRSVGVSPLVERGKLKSRGKRRQSPLLPLRTLPLNNLLAVRTTVEQRNNDLLKATLQKLQNLHRVVQENSKAVVIPRPKLATFLHGHTPLSTSRSQNLSMSNMETDTASASYKSHQSQQWQKSNDQFSCIQDWTSNDLFFTTSSSEGSDGLSHRAFSAATRSFPSDEESGNPSYAHAQGPLQDLMMNFTARFRENAIMPRGFEELFEGIRKNDQGLFDHLLCETAVAKIEEEAEEEAEGEEEAEEEEFKEEEKSEGKSNKGSRIRLFYEGCPLVSLIEDSRSSDNNIIIDSSSSQSLDISHVKSLKGSPDLASTEPDTSTNSLECHPKRRRLDISGTFVGAANVLQG